MNQTSTLPFVDILPGLIVVVSQAFKIGLVEGYGIFVEDKRVSVEKPGVIRYNPRDLVWEDSVVQQVEHSINARLASSDDQILVVAVSH